MGALTNKTVLLYHAWYWKILLSNAIGADFTHLVMLLFATTVLLRVHYVHTNTRKEVLLGGSKGMMVS